MKVREYYLDTEANKTYFIDICGGDFVECEEHIHNFFSDFDKDSMIYIFTKESLKLLEVLKEYTETQKNHVALYSSHVVNLDGAVDMVDHIQTKRYCDTPTPWQISSGEDKENIVPEQKVFNITKKYLREQKLNRICQDSNQENQ